MLILFVENILKFTLSRYWLLLLLTFFGSYSHTILFHLMCTRIVKYPPIMSAVKNADGNVSHYKGYTAEFIYYIGKHFEWRYIKYHTGYLKVKKIEGSAKFKIY